MSVTKRLGALLALLALLLVTGCAAKTYGETGITGIVESREVDVNTKIPGRVVELMTEEGQRVTAGSPLAKIDDRELKVKELQALAGIAAAKGDLAKATATASMYQGSTAADLQSAEAALAEARAIADLAGKTYQRLEELHKSQAISDQDLDKAEKDLKTALAAVSRTEGSLSRARAARLQVDVYQAEITRAQAALAKAEADLEQIRINLEETEIKAPCTGVITSLNVEKGELVSTGMPLMTVSDYGENWVNVKVKQSILDQISEGQEAKLTAISMPGKVFTGKIVDISRKPEFATWRATNDRGEKDIVSYNVKIRVNSEELRPGMTVSVQFH